MTANGRSGLDLQSLAADVVEGRRSLDNVIDQIVVATPDNRRRRHAVAELQLLILARTGAQAGARTARRWRRGPTVILTACAIALVVAVIAAVAAGWLGPASGL